LIHKEKFPAEPVLSLAERLEITFGETFYDFINLDDPVKNPQQPVWGILRLRLLPAFVKEITSADRHLGDCVALAGYVIPNPA